MTVTEQTLVASPRVVFDTIADPITYPQWLVGTKRIVEVAPSWPEPGASFRHVVGFGPLALSDRTTVCELERSQMLEMFVRARPIIEATVRLDVRPHPTGCVLRMTETPTGWYKLISPILQPFIRARNERSLRRLVNVVSSRLAASA